MLIIQGGLPRTLTKPLGLEGKNGRNTGQKDLSQNGGFDDPMYVSLPQRYLYVHYMYIP